MIKQWDFWCLNVLSGTLSTVGGRVTVAMQTFPKE